MAQPPPVQRAPRGHRITLHIRTPWPPHECARLCAPAAWAMRMTHPYPPPSYAASRPSVVVSALPAVADQAHAQPPSRAGRCLPRC
eukprot:12043-Eustigmatos_ZCMA.PRE.1